MLVEFGRNIRVSTKIGDGVAGRRVRNDFAVLPARDFLQRLCDSYGLVWYFDSAVLHISSESEVRTELINLSSVAPDRLMEKLDALGVSDPRFGIRVNEDSSVVAVSGPPSFLELVGKTLSALEKAHAPRPVREVTNGDTLNVRVFRGGRGS